MDVAFEFERTTALILASENWHEQYTKHSPLFGKLTRAEAKLNRSMLEYFHDQAKEVINSIAWAQYHFELGKAQKTEAAATDQFNVDVIVRHIADTLTDEPLIKILYEPIITVAKLGIQSGILDYKLPFSDETITEAVDRVAGTRIAELVGKTWDAANGTYIDNPRANYSINDTTRDLIRDSIRTSLGMGEDQAVATDRLQSVIVDRSRAEKIASTEAVNGYQGGLNDYAKTTGATGKEWQSVPGACEICQGNVDDGEVGINDTFSSGDEFPSAHPWCRCGLVYVYNEQ